MIDLEQVRLVIWDLDGTIIDSYGIFSEIVSEAGALSGIPKPTAEAIKHNFHGSLDESIQNVLAITKPDVLQTVIADFLKIQEAYYAEPEAHLYKDVVPLAQHLHDLGATQVVVTNRNHEGRGSASPRHIIASTAMAGLIDRVISGDEVEYRKPDVRALAGVSLPPAEQILVVGDQFVDAQLAANLGALALLVNRFEDPIPHLETLADSNHITVVPSLTAIL